MKITIRAAGNQWLVYAAVLGFTVCASVVWACQVPVFRYALERWTPERYPVVVITKEALSENERQKWLGDYASRLDSQVQIQWKNSSELASVEERDVWKRFAENDIGVVMTYYPEKSDMRGTVAHATKLDVGSFETMLTSPARQEIAKRLSAGESAVWVLLRSGNAAADMAAQNAIETQLALDEEWLKLPSAEEMEIKPEILSSVSIKLKVDFSVLSISREDPKEKFLVDCLLNSESDLQAFPEPIAFPVFGRGLVLYALVGKGINSDTVRAASSFICGPCSCQVKEQNPGFDLLLEHDWSNSLGSVFISQPIPGVGSQPKLLQIPPGRKK